MDRQARVGPCSAHGKDSETLNVVYITDNHNRLIDDLRIREILLAPLHEHVSSLLDDRFVALSVTDSKRPRPRLFREYRSTALLVVNTSRLSGRHRDDRRRAGRSEQEATREIQRLGGLEALDEPYATTPLLVMVRKHTRGWCCCSSANC